MCRACSFTSSSCLVSATSFHSFIPPPALRSSLRAFPRRFPQCISTLPPDPADRAAGKTPPSSTSTPALPRESWHLHPPPVHPPAPPAHASAPAPIPNSRNTGTSSPHTILGSSATPPAPVPTTFAASHSRPNRNVPPSLPARARNPSSPRAQKTEPAATATPSPPPRNR